MHLAAANMWDWFTERTPGAKYTMLCAKRRCSLNSYPAHYLSACSLKKHQCHLALVCSGPFPSLFPFLFEEFFFHYFSRSRLRPSFWCISKLLAWRICSTISTWFLGFTPRLQLVLFPCSQMYHCQVGRGRKARAERLQSWNGKRGKLR